MHEIPFIVKEDFLDEGEFSQVVEETETLLDSFIEVEFSRPATKDGVILKHSSGMMYDDYYNGLSKELSSTVKIFHKKIFDNFLYSEFEQIGTLCHNLNWTSMMISYYENDDYYKPHFDASFITGLYWFDIRPQRKFAGGELYLYNGTKFMQPDAAIPFQPVNNRFVAFPSCYLHEVNPIVLSERFKGQGYGRFCITMFCGHGS